MTSHNTYLADTQLADRYSVSRSTIWRWSHNGRLTKPVKISPGCTRWRLADIEAWEAEKLSHDL